MRKELQVAKVVETTTWKTVEEETSLLRKTKLENEVFHTEVQKPKLKNASLSSTKAKAEEKGAQPKLELEQNWVSFVKEKKYHDVAY